MAPARHVVRLIEVLVFVAVAEAPPSDHARLDARVADVDAVVDDSHQNRPRKNGQRIGDTLSRQ